MTEVGWRWAEGSQGSRKDSQALTVKGLQRIEKQKRGGKIEY